MIFWDWIRLLRTTYRGLSHFPPDGWTYACFENMHIYIEKISSWPTSCCRLVSKEEKGSLCFWYHAYWLSIVDKELERIWVVIENATGLRFPNSTSPLSCSLWDYWISKRFTMSSARELVHLKHTKRKWKQDFLFLNLYTIFAYRSVDLLFKKMFSLNPGSS